MRRTESRELQSAEQPWRQEAPSAGRQASRLTRLFCLRLTFKCSHIARSLSNRVPSCSFYFSTSPLFTRFRRRHGRRRRRRRRRSAELGQNPQTFPHRVVRGSAHPTHTHHLRRLTWKCHCLYNYVNPSIQKDQINSFSF